MQGPRFGARCPQNSRILITLSLIQSSGSFIPEDQTPYTLTLAGKQDVSYLQERWDFLSEKVDHLQVGEAVNGAHIDAHHSQDNGQHPECLAEGHQHHGQWNEGGAD